MSPARRRPGGASQTRRRHGRAVRAEPADRRRSSRSLDRGRVVASSRSTLGLATLVRRSRRVAIGRRCSARVAASGRRAAAARGPWSTRRDLVLRNMLDTARDPAGRDRRGRRARRCWRSGPASSATSRRRSAAPSGMTRRRSTARDTRSPRASAHRQLRPGDAYADLRRRSGSRDLAPTARDRSRVAPGSPEQAALAADVRRDLARGREIVALGRRSRWRSSSGSIVADCALRGPRGLMPSRRSRRGGRRPRSGRRPRRRSGSHRDDDLEVALELGLGAARPDDHPGAVGEAVAQPVGRRQVGACRAPGRRRARRRGRRARSAACVAQPLHRGADLRPGRSTRTESWSVACRPCSSGDVVEQVEQACGPRPSARRRARRAAAARETPSLSRTCSGSTQ